VGVGDGGVQVTTPLPSSRALDHRRPSVHAFGLAAVAISLFALFHVSGDADERPENAPAWLVPALIELDQDGRPLHVRNLLPGQFLVQQINVRNVGWIPARYSLTYATRPVGAGHDLADGLHVELRLVGTGCQVFDGQLLAQGPLADFAMGDQAAGPQAGDRVLDVGQAETVCVRVAMAGASNNLQGAGVLIRLTAHAEGVGQR
jgi:hypothetical protein